MQKFLVALLLLSFNNPAWAGFADKAEKYLGITLVGNTITIGTSVNTISIPGILQFDTTGTIVMENGAQLGNTPDGTVFLEENDDAVEAMDFQLRTSNEAGEDGNYIH